MHAATRVSSGIFTARLADTRAFRARRAKAVASHGLGAVSMSSSASSKPTLYDIPVSNNGARVRLLLYWKGLESAFRVENPSALGGLKSEAYLALNPQGKMPLLVVPSDDADESLAIPESEVIAQYVLHAYADVGPALIPEDPKQRALAALVTRVHDVYIAPIQGCLYRGPMPVSKRAEDLARRREADGRRRARLRRRIAFSCIEKRKRRRPVRLRREAVLRGRRVVPDVRLPRTHLAEVLQVGRRVREPAANENVVPRDGARRLRRRVLGEIRAGLDDWHDAGRWEKTGVLEAVKDDTYTWKY